MSKENSKGETYRHMKKKESLLQQLADFCQTTAQSDHLKLSRTFVNI